MKRTRTGMLAIGITALLSAEWRVLASESQSQSATTPPVRSATPTSERPVQLPPETTGYPRRPVQPDTGERSRRRPVEPPQVDQRYPERPVDQQPAEQKYRRRPVEPRPVDEGYP